MSKPAEIHFRPVSTAPPGGGLKLLKNALDHDRQDAFGVFASLRDGWSPTIYVTGDGEMFVNEGLWNLGRSILRGDREAALERAAIAGGAAQ
jgi:hypothetical protein